MEVASLPNLSVIPKTISSRASKLKDHKIGRSPYFYETKSGDFSWELFKALPKTKGLLRKDLHTVVRSALFTFNFGMASQSDVVKPGDDNDMPLLCLTVSACAKLRCRLGSFLSKPFICFATLSDIARKTR